MPKGKIQYSSRHRKKLYTKKKPKYSSRHRKKIIHKEKKRKPSILLPHIEKKIIHKENTSVGMKQLEVAKLLVWKHSGPCTSGYLDRIGFGFKQVET
jgi:hypothetical protein